MIHYKGYEVVPRTTRRDEDDWQAEVVLEKHHADGVRPNGGRSRPSGAFPARVRGAGGGVGAGAPGPGRGGSGRHRRGPLTCGPHRVTMARATSTVVVIVVTLVAGLPGAGVGGPTGAGVAETPSRPRSSSSGSMGSGPTCWRRFATPHLDALARDGRADRRRAHHDPLGQRAFLVLHAHRRVARQARGHRQRVHRPAIRRRIRTFLTRVEEVDPDAVDGRRRGLDPSRAGRRSRLPRSAMRWTVKHVVDGYEVGWSEADRLVADRGRGGAHDDRSRCPVRLSREP